jgi:hypothetical protein
MMIAGCTGNRKPSTRRVPRVRVAGAGTRPGAVGGVGYVWTWWITWGKAYSRCTRFRLIGDLAERPEVFLAGSRAA